MAVKLACARPVAPLFVFTAAMQALAAPAATADDHAAAIEEVVVRGQKIERTVLDTKESIAVITSADIERRSLQTLEDVYNQTANAFDLGNNEGFGIRGVTNNSGSTLGGDGELATYFIDGVAITGFAKRFVPMDMWDVAQVEILRGPQSTNLGRNAMLGAVVVTSEAPDPQARTIDLHAGVGNVGRREAAATLNLPLGERAALRLTGEYLEHDGHIDNPTRGKDDFDARENTTLRAKLLLQPTDSVEILAGLQFVASQRGQNLFRFDLVDDVEDRDNFGSLDDEEDLDGTLATLDVRWAINERWTLRSITSHLDAEYDRIDDDDLSPAGGNAFRGRHAEDRNWAEELRLDHASEHLRGTVGVYYTEVDLRNETRGLVNIEPALVGVPAPLLPFYPAVIEINVDSPFKGKTENLSVFTEWDWDAGERLTLSVGARYEQEQQDSVARVANTLVDPNALPDPALAGPFAGFVAQVNGLLLSQLTPSEERTDPDFDVLLGKLGATWQVDDEVAVSAFFTQGYRAGGAELNLTGRQSDYDPEYLNNVEVALRANLPAINGSLLANAYYGDWTDQQVSIGLNGNIFDIVVENAGESTIYGAELELRAAPSDAVDLWLAVGWAETEFDDYQSAIDGDLSGNDFAFSPNLTAALGGTWSNGPWSVGGSVTVQGEAWADVQNTMRLDHRTLVNLQAAYSATTWRVALYGKNVFDEVYVTSLGTGLSPGAVVGKLGDPREVGLQVTVAL